MNAKPVGLSLGDLFRSDFRTSREADELNARAQATLGLDYRYQMARLAVALSLSDASPPPPPADLLGKPIRGETLFGQEEMDLALWTALIVEHDPDAAASRKRFVEIVGAHWERGMRRLWRRWTTFEGAPETFVDALVSARSAN